MSERLKALADAGVSIWLDDLSRERIETGNLADLVKNSSVVGVTTNPTIFASALSDGERYDAQVRELAAGRQGRGRGDLRDHHDRRARRLRRAQGRPSTPPAASTAACRSRSSPGLAHDEAATIASAKELWAEVDRENLFIKIPATTEGAPAITDVLGEGISVNVTLIFGLDRYDAVMDAYLEGLEKAKANGHDLSKIHSVASFFVSRVDTEIDKRLEAVRRPAGRQPDGPRGHRQRPAGLPGLREEVRRRALRGPQGRRRQHPAPAVGVDRREEPGLPRHDVRHRPRGRATPSTRCPRRPCRPSPTTARSRATRSPRSTPRRSRSWTTWPRSASTTTT